MSEEKSSEYISAEDVEGFEETTDLGDSSKKSKSPKKPRNKKRIIIWCVVVAVIAAGGIGMFVWHEQPSFCGTVCHTPMADYLCTYEAEPGEASTDKWGNEVADASGMLSATHRAYGDLTCMDCHQPNMTEQVTEGLEWVQGKYYAPLSERDNERLVYYRGTESKTFCLNSSCHNMTKEDLTEATSNMTRNPHSWHHNEYDCNDCHKAHRASVMICSQCHEDAQIPEGWISADEAENLEVQYGSYDDEYLLEDE